MAEAVLALSEGRTVVYPTDTLWGLGCDIYNKDAVEQVHKLKGSPEAKPLSVAVHKAAKMDQLGVMNDLADELAEAFLPGPLTIIVPKRGRISQEITAGLDTIGLRVPDNRTARKLAEVFGPVTTTSANAHGQPPLLELAEVRDAFGDAVGYYLDGEAPRYDEPSTVVDATADRLRIVREGVVKKDELEAWL